MLHAEANYSPIRKDSGNFLGQNITLFEIRFHAKEIDLVKLVSI